MVKTRKYKSICNEKPCSPYFCQGTKRCRPKQSYTLETLPLKRPAKKASSRFLKACPSVEDCVTLGTHLSEAHAYFHDLSTFEDVHETLHRIKTSSGNGFLYVIPYRRNKETFHTILKSSKKNKSDNLLYEFLIGHAYINPLVDKLPCFIYTYGLYYYKNEQHWKHMYDSNQVAPKVLKHALVPQTSIQYDKACADSKYISIVIQGLKHSERVSDKIKSQRFLNDNLAHVLFILYHTLSTLSKSFTHYDLHVDNVLLARLPSNKYIRYVYHIHDMEVSFLCPYIPKIIDYGRCFFDNGTIQSKMVYDKICDECESCGKYSGFTLLSPRKFFTISSQVKNESHDLRLLVSISSEMEYSSSKSNTTFTRLRQLFQKVIYGRGIEGSKKTYGTLEQSKLNPDGSSIGNVTDAYYQLLYLITSPEVVQENNVPREMDGTLHVYQDRPMRYVKEP